MPVWIVDAMNVIGSRPTGWWRDRGAAVRRLADDARRFAAATGDSVILVVDGRPLADLPEGEHDGVRIAWATRRGADAADDRIVELVRGAANPAELRVVTSDRTLRARVGRLGAEVESARSWLRALDDGTPGLP